MIQDSFESTPLHVAANEFSLQQQQQQQQQQQLQSDFSHKLVIEKQNHEPKQQQLLVVQFKATQLLKTWNELMQRQKPQKLLKAEMQLVQENDSAVDHIIHEFMEQQLRFKHSVHKKELEFKKLLNPTRKQKQEKQSEMEKLLHQYYEQESRFVLLMQEKISEIEELLNKVKFREQQEMKHLARPSVCDAHTIPKKENLVLKHPQRQPDLVSSSTPVEIKPGGIGVQKSSLDQSPKIPQKSERKVMFARRKSGIIRKDSAKGHR